MKVTHKEVDAQAGRGMPETFQTEYQSIPDMDGPTVPGRKFFVERSGVTNGAHLAMVAEFQRNGQIEVATVAESDYILLFCPIASRVGTDISEALERAPGNRPMILMVMHHTFNADYVLADSWRVVDNPNVLLTVDCLFYNDHLLDSRVNDKARSAVQRVLSAHSHQPHRGGPFEAVTKWVKENRIIVICVLLLVVTTVVVIVSVESKKK